MTSSNVVKSADGRDGKTFTENASIANLSWSQERDWWNANGLTNVENAELEVQQAEWKTEEINILRYILYFQLKRGEEMRGSESSEWERKKYEKVEEKLKCKQNQKGKSIDRKNAVKQQDKTNNIPRR